jgi:uncharacterized protein
VPISDLPSDWSLRMQIPEQDVHLGTTEMDWDVAIRDTISYVGELYSFKTPLHVHAESRWADESLMVDIYLDSTISVPCIRCLEMTDIALKTHFMYLYSLRDKETAAGKDDEHLVRVDMLEKQLDITQQVWESLILSLPTNPLCKEDCRGLCPICGASLNKGDCGCRQNNIDPRLADLLKFKDEDSEV